MKIQNTFMVYKNQTMYYETKKKKTETETKNKPPET